jgi:Na+-driven multidrug efflux pump
MSISVIKYIILFYYFKKKKKKKINKKKINKNQLVGLSNNFFNINFLSFFKFNDLIIST